MMLMVLAYDKELLAPEKSVRRRIVEQEEVVELF